LKAGIGLWLRSSFGRSKQAHKPLSGPFGAVNEMILTIIVFLIIIGILVIAHELGHFIVAKKSGVKVEEFAFGFPPRLFSFKRGETRYSINLLPLGGYVKMLGELEHSKDKRAFENQSPWKRFWISIAGVLMNVILAWFLLSIGFAVGMSPIVTPSDQIPGKKLSSEILVAEIGADTPADKSQIQLGDNIVAGEINGEKVNFSSISDLQNFNDKNRGKEVKYTLIRDNETLDKNVLLSDMEESQLGVGLVERSIVRVVWYKAPFVALRETVEVIKLTFSFLGSFFAKLFTSGKVDEGVGGPVAIYTFTGLAVQAGVMVILQFVALLSINLALINILPFPALDGGRLLFIILEKIKGKRIVREKIENIIHTVGFAILILLVLAVTYRDIIRLFNK